MAEVAAIFTADISGYTSAMSRMASSTTSATKGASNLGSKVSSAMSTVGKVTTAAGAATTAMGVSALKSYGTFQQSLNKAAIIAGGTSKDIGQLADMANKMGAELPLSAQDAADAMVSMAQDGPQQRWLQPLDDRGQKQTCSLLCREGRRPQPPLTQTAKIKL